MKVSQINSQTYKPKFKAKIEEKDSSVKFWEEIQPSKTKPKKWAKVNQALGLIEKSLENETIIINKGWGEISAVSKNTGLELLYMNPNLNPFATLPNFVIRLGKKFNEQFVPLVEHMEKLKVRK